MNDENDKKKISINCSEEIATGKYSNLLITNLSNEELIIDFAMLYPQSNQANVQSRIVLTHGNAKKLHSLLAKHLEDLEKEQPQNDDEPNQGIRFSVN